MADFASMLKYLRERENLSQRELASRLNMSSSAISMYETGKRQPRFEDEECIADFFNVDINTLRGRNVENQLLEAYIKNAQDQEFLELYHQADPVIQQAVLNFLKNAPHDP